MKISKIRIKNFRSIIDTGEIMFTENLFVLAGQNESGKSSILEALNCFESGKSDIGNLNFGLENNSENNTQEIQCTFNDFDEAFYIDLQNELLALMKTENLSINIATTEKYIDVKLLRNLKNCTYNRIFHFSSHKPQSKLELDSISIAIIKSAIKFQKVFFKNGIERKFVNQPLISENTLNLNLPEILWNLLPKIILFNDFTSLLPDKILLEQLDNEEIEGQVAVKNIEQLLTIDFNKISQKQTPQKNSTTEHESNLISISFQEDWKQKIYGNNEVKIKFFIENNDEGQKEISFFVETKDNEYLAPRKRSKGMIWFLSLWLELKARSRENTLILLFDEPGLHLHIKANRDMLNVFHKLANNGHQILYSTHSPSLIETDKLHQIGLVVNSEKNGTTIEGLTTSKLNSENKRDALQPIAEAMGLEPLRDFSILKQKNVLLEGLSDFWILKGFEKLLEMQLNYAFVPGVGIKGSKINPLISFCIGYGLDWLLVMDKGVNPDNLRNILKEDIFNGDESDTNSKILLIDESEIENLFDIKDLTLIDDTLKADINKAPIEIIGSRRKIIFSKIFYQGVLNGKIKKSQLKPSTLRKFEYIFNWIEKQFNR